ncbi:MAG: hypothetical protein ACE366_03845 [Bradymonadia bacterium]
MKACTSVLAVSLMACAGESRAQAPTQTPEKASIQSVIHYNARMALREEAPREVLKLWLLRNAVEHQTHTVSARDADFRSVTWAALGDLGICPDGFPTDEGGAGLWPLALHNWLLDAMRRSDPGSPGNPWVAFKLGRQMRHVSLHDVLDAEELTTVRFRRASCWQHLWLLWDASESLFSPINDRRVNGRLMRHLLRQSLEHLDVDHVVGRALVQARIFDLNLALSGLNRKAARRQARKQRQEAMAAGLARADVSTAPANLGINPDSEEGKILAESLTWSAEEWLTLSSERRQFLFAQAIYLSKDRPALETLIISVIDALIEARAGAEVQSWIAHLDAEGDEATRALIWSGDRGERLLSLDEETGFRERGALALHQGVDHLAGGHMAASIRSLALAMKWSERSRRPESVRNLGRRWLSFVAAQFKVTDELFAMLRSTLPRTDYTVVLEDQLWHAALGADAESFERCVKHQVGRGALKDRVEWLRPLSQGDGDAWTDLIKAQLADSPYATYRFLKQFVQRLQVQGVSIRTQYVPLMRALKSQLDAIAAEARAARRKARQAETLSSELQALVEGLTGLEGANTLERAGTLSPDHTLFAGPVRVAPADTLPWPFVVAEVESPPVFTPIKLKPEEWRQRDNTLIFGWRISD